MPPSAMKWRASGTSTKTGAAVELRFYAVREYKGELENRIFKDMRWAKRSELPSFDFLEADLGLVRNLVEGKLP